MTLTKFLFLAECQSFAEYRSNDSEFYELVPRENDSWEKPMLVTLANAINCKNLQVSTRRKLISIPEETIFSAINHHSTIFFFMAL